MTPEQLLAAARAMVPRLRERQPLAEAEGRLPEQTQREFVTAGFYRILQPRRFGGYEFDLPTFVRVMATIASGCPSSGWVLALTAGHAHTLAALFPEQTQVEIFGPDGEYRAPLSGNGQGLATPTDGGYRVRGAWNYVSGCEIATHFIGMAATDADPPQRLFVLFARDEFSIVPDWDVMGMRGTGSHRVTVDDVFIPARRAIPQAMDEAASRQAAGRSVHANPMYRAGRIGSVLFGEMAAVALGIAQGALELYERDLRTKKMAYPPYASRGDQPEYQRHFGEAFSLVTTAEALCLRIAEDYMRFADDEVNHGIVFSDLRDSQLRLLEQQATRIAADAVDLMFRSAGTSAARTAAPLQRYFRDMAMIRTHFAAQVDRGSQEFGQRYLAS